MYLYRVHNIIFRPFWHVNSKKETIWVFPKWLCLNSANSVNHNQIQEQYDYQRYYPCGNRYIASTSNTKCIFITTSGYISIATHHSTDSSGKLLFTTISRSVSIVRYRISLVTIQLLDLVMIHWVHWIQRKLFRENSTVSFYVQIDKMML